MDKILVSTITPCFRMKRYLKKFLEELPKQTMFKNLEVVLDHNEPDEEEILWVKEFQAKYPNKIKHIVANKVDPIGVSMNRCIKESQGEILTIWNVDDLRAENSIELQHNKIIENNKNGLVFGNFLVVKSFGATKGKMVNCSKINEKEFTRSMIFGPFFMFRKDLCDKVGYFDEQLRSGADFDFCLKLAFYTKPVYVEGLLGYYLNEGLGASTRPDSLQAVERTVIELRYGIYDKIDYGLVAKATQYNITFSLFNNEYVKISSYISNYSDMINKRLELWQSRGVKVFIIQKILCFSFIKSKLKIYIKIITKYINK